jgi:hypothetical protein
MTKQEKLIILTKDEIMYVYSGKAYKCCCGCSGNYRYNSKHVNAGTKDRGYTVGPNEINDKQIARVLTIMKKNSHLMEFDDDDNLFSVTVGNRLYMARTIKGN